MSAECEHKEFHFGSGGYYIFCSGCGLEWVAKKGVDNNPDYERSRVMKDRFDSLVSKKSLAVAREGLVEPLAAQFHDAWMRWTKRYASLVPLDVTERWKILWRPYLELTEEMKELDRKEARSALASLDVRPPAAQEEHTFDGSPCRACGEPYIPQDGSQPEKCEKCGFICPALACHAWDEEQDAHYHHQSGCPNNIMSFVLASFDQKKGGEHDL